MSTRIEKLRVDFRELRTYFAANEVDEFDELFEEFEELINWADEMNSAIDDHIWETF
jgi:hypothetical protein